MIIVPPHDRIERCYMGGMACAGCSLQGALEILRTWLTTDTREASRHFPASIHAVNAHIYTMAHDDLDLARRLDSSSLLLADGMALVWASRLFRNPLPERCNLTEFFRLYMGATDLPQTTAVLVGCSAEEARQAAAAIHAQCQHCRIIATHDGFRSMDAYRSILGTLNPKPDLLLVGMGTPRSEELMEIAAECHAARVLWHIGGGTIKFLAGTDIEAPVWMRRTGLQWLHRLLRNPSLCRRYLIGNPRFVWLVLQAARQARLTREKVETHNGKRSIPGSGD